MNARQRLDNLVRLAGAGRAGRCAACGADDERPRTVLILPPRLAKGPPPDANPCGSCGRTPLVVEIVFTPAAPGRTERARWN